MNKKDMQEALNARLWELAEIERRGSSQESVAVIVAARELRLFAQHIGLDPCQAWHTTKPPIPDPDYPKSERAEYIRKNGGGALWE